MSDAFISYRRKPSAALAQLIQEKLHNRYGIDAYVDTTRTDGSSVQFPNRLMTAIAEAPTFICLLGDTTLESEWVRKEIQRAFELQKFCIPVFQESYVPPKGSDDAIEYLLRFDGIHVLDIKNIYIDKAIEDIAGLIKRSKVRRPFLLWVVLLGIVLLGLVAAFLLLMNGDDDTPTPTVSQEVAQQPSDTPNPAENETAVAAAIQEQTEIAATSTPTTQPTRTPTNTPPPTATPTFSPTPPTSTLSVNEIAQATVNALATNNEQQRQLSATAFAHETETAFPLTQAAQATEAAATQQAQNTLDAFAVQTRVVELQATQTTWTPTTTLTPTPTPTDTSTRTPTHTATSTTDPDALARAGVTRNADWTPYSESDAQGVDMVLVPAGTFTMGSTEEQLDFGLTLCQQAADNNAECQRSWFEDEAPTSQQTMNAFWLDRTEVTRAQYQVCVDAGACESTPDSEYSTEPDQPMNRVTWFQARDYCAWRGARLPTEAEWEYAARGPDGLLFPWGNAFDGSEANHCDRNCSEQDWASSYNYKNEENDDGYAMTAPVGSYPQGASWVGALDMSGNVWEWTSSVYNGYPYDRNDGREADHGDRTDVLYILRGGSFSNTTNNLRAANRFRLIPDFEVNYVGVRCARSS